MFSCILRRRTISQRRDPLARERNFFARRREQGLRTGNANRVNNTTAQPLTSNDPPLNIERFEQLVSNRQARPNRARRRKHSQMSSDLISLGVYDRVQDISEPVPRPANHRRKKRNDCASSKSKDCTEPGNGTNRTVAVDGQSNEVQVFENNVETSILAAAMAVPWKRAHQQLIPQRNPSPVVTLSGKKSPEQGREQPSDGVAARGYIQAGLVRRELAKVSSRERSSKWYDIKSLPAAAGSKTESIGHSLKSTQDCHGIVNEVPLSQNKSKKREQGHDVELGPDSEDFYRWFTASKISIVKDSESKDPMKLEEFNPEIAVIENRLFFTADRNVGVFGSMTSSVNTSKKSQVTAKSNLPVKPGVPRDLEGLQASEDGNGKQSQNQKPSCLTMCDTNSKLLTSDHHAPMAVAKVPGSSPFLTSLKPDEKVTLVAVQKPFANNICTAISSPDKRTKTTQ